jgi:hypothetical protein
MPLTDPSQAAVGNTLDVEGHTLTIAGTITSSNGDLLVLQGQDSAVCVLALAGHLLDSENVEFVSSPAVPGASVEAQSREAAQDAEIQALKARVEYLSKQEQSQEAPPATEATGATDVPGDAPAPDANPDATPATPPEGEPSPSTTTIQE